MDSLTERFEKDVFGPYLELLKAQYRFHPNFAHAKKIWEEKLTSNILVNGPYIEKSITYAPGEPLETLPLHEKTVKTIQKRLDGRSLYKHQIDALKLLLAEKNAVVATGTSSGKTLCYQIPILDDLIRNSDPGLRAIIIYPLNALVNDQLTEWEQLLKDYPQIRFARFTGQTPDSQTEYEKRITDAAKEKITDERLSQQEFEREIIRILREQLERDKREIPNRLNHRDAIRNSPPHILITNFSMLEYLLERPIDAPIFEMSRLKYLVLDEAHAYRGVQATEIAFLVRRLKDRLKVEKLTCIATSATLGKKGNEESTRRVRDFAFELFGEDFSAENPIYGTSAEPILEQPSHKPSPAQYIQAAENIHRGELLTIPQALGLSASGISLADILARDQNLFKLRKHILQAPKPLSVVANELWPLDPFGSAGLQGLLDIAVVAKADNAHEDVLPTRLHYFVRAQDGLHICLHSSCPGRRNGKPAYFVTRAQADVPNGNCPDCHMKGFTSKLVEVLTCRKCGYLYGGLQDLGPRRAQNQESSNDVPKPYFDSFCTELGWAADSFWSYFSIEPELPYPPKAADDFEDEEQTDLLTNPAELSWCTSCGKKKDNGAGDNCNCDKPNTRQIKIFHRQCVHTGRPKDSNNLYNQGKKLLTCCPNCGARNGSGLEPVRRFQESDDETGLAMAIPLAHFQVSPNLEKKIPRKLLCFTDHRQRAAAFPSLLEEETFTHDLGRKIVKIIREKVEPITLIDLGEKLADIADPQSPIYDTDFFLPVSRYPDEDLDAKAKRDLWVAEVFGYFGIPDSARESAEDLGLIAVEYQISPSDNKRFVTLLEPYQLTTDEASTVLQHLLGWMRQRKAFTLPRGRVQPDATAFGRVTADISFVARRKGIRNTNGWLPELKKDGTYRDNYITDYLRRLTHKPPAEVLKLAEVIWEYLTSQVILISNKETYKLDHERIRICKPASRFVCPRCGIVTAYSIRQCCPRKDCVGKLNEKPFDAIQENIIARWVADANIPQFTTLKSEEHTAQINKDLAKIIEDAFRGQGINLLSSTTTFEMGINIGDLQKVLLRNAPPTSASYVQRVGRAGRGKDKNSVCVTLCRCTKYDSDAWSNPPRLMSGEVRTPTVFISNRVIAQRHFNAIAFAKYLKIKVGDERVLGNLKQQVRLEAFLPIDSRANIPENWFQIKPTNLLLNFLEWFENQNEADIFNSNAGRSMLPAVLGFTQGKVSAIEKYSQILKEVSVELDALMTERQKLYKQGGHMSDVERAIKNLLGNDIIALLAKRGFLPRYAFPLDMVTLETGPTRWSRDSDVELSRDRGLAIAEFAPSAQVIAHKKVFTSEGLYIVGNTDRPEVRWYAKCPSCEQVRTFLTQDQLLRACPVCNRPITSQYARRYVEPSTYSVRIDKKEEGGARYRRSTLVRQRQTITHFIDIVDESKFIDKGQFRIVLNESGSLFRYNSGPKSDGFMLCLSCGFSLPQWQFRADTTHLRLRAFSGSRECHSKQIYKAVSYGHKFESFCLIVRPNISINSVESLSYALQKGLCKTLDIEPSDIGVSWRWLGKKSTAPNSEIILYDLTPGGAGFVKEGFENWQDVLVRSKDICASCSCEVACYDCLKNYSNQAYHEKLNRLEVVKFLI